MRKSIIMSFLIMTPSCSPCEGERPTLALGKKVIEAIKSEKTLKVPDMRLGADHSKHFEVPHSKLDKLTPFLWAVTLDLSRGEEKEEAHRLYTIQCMKNPKLEEDVERLFFTKAMLESAKRKRRLPGN